MKDKVKIIKLGSVSSTNEYIKQFAMNNDGETIVVIADSQTNGKGTRGRSFISKEGGVYLSILLHTDLKAFDATLITALTAVAVCDSIQQISGKNPQIKWVNDVYLNNKKVCGILCESVVAPSGEMPYIIVGIGINLFRPLFDFDDEIKDIATSVFEKYDSDIKNKFINILLKNFFENYQCISEKRFIEKYRRLNFLLGKKIIANIDNKTFEVTAIDIDKNCRLVVKFSDESVMNLSSGEVNIKL